MRRTIAITIAAAIVWAAPLWAAPGDVDPTFGAGSDVVTPFSSFFTMPPVTMLQVDPANRIVVAARLDAETSSDATTIALMRYEPNGTVDTSFGVDGLVRFPPEEGKWLAAITLDATGRPLVAIGTTREEHDEFTITRLTLDGRVDETFGNRGSVVWAADSFGLANLFARGDGLLLEFLEESPPFPPTAIQLVTFAPDGAQTDTLRIREALEGFYTEILQSIVEPDGRLVTIGLFTLDGVRRLGVDRFDLDGSHDVAFSNNARLLTTGINRFSTPTGQLGPDGSLVFTWMGERFDLVVVRLLSDGRPDPDFGTDGVVSVEIPDQWTRSSAVAVQPDRSIYVAGEWDASFLGGFWLVGALLPNGTLDTDFGAHGFVVRTEEARGSDASAIALQPDGRLVVAGTIEQTQVLTRYLGTPRACGDADGNTTVTVTDGVQVLRAAADLSSSCLPDCCDVDASGVISVTDGVLVLRHAAGLDAALDCP